MQKFSLGCNYWASNAGVHMWSEWDESAVENDLKNLSEAFFSYDTGDNISRGKRIDLPCICEKKI